jgi:hypothetical protein
MKNPVGILFADTIHINLNQSHEKKPGRNISGCALLDGLHFYVIIPFIFSCSIPLIGMSRIVYKPKNQWQCDLTLNYS